MSHNSDTVSPYLLRAKRCRLCPMITRAALPLAVLLGVSGCDHLNGITCSVENGSLVCEDDSQPVGSTGISQEGRAPLSEASHEQPDRSVQESLHGYEETPSLLSRS